MTILTLLSSPTPTTAPEKTRTVARRRERFIDNCFSSIILTLLFSSAIYAVSQLFTLAS